ncbi:MAG: hypothetical protein U1F36_02245 [Planctomycetota bacterium]
MRSPERSRRRSQSPGAALLFLEAKRALFCDDRRITLDFDAHAAALRDDGAALFVQSAEDGSLRCLDPGGALCFAIPVDTPRDRPVRFAMTRDGARLTLLTSPQVVSLFADERRIAVIGEPGPIATITRMAFAPEGDHLIAGDGRHWLEIDLRDGSMREHSVGACPDPLGVHGGDRVGDQIVDLVSRAEARSARDVLHVSTRSIFVHGVPAPNWTWPDSRTSNPPPDRQVFAEGAGSGNAFVFGCGAASLDRDLPGELSEITLDGHVHPVLPALSRVPFDVDREPGGDRIHWTDVEGLHTAPVGTFGSDADAATGARWFRCVDRTLGVSHDGRRLQWWDLCAPARLKSIDGPGVDGRIQFAAMSSARERLAVATDRGIEVFAIDRR